MITYLVIFIDKLLFFKIVFARLRTQRGWLWMSPATSGTWQSCCLRPATGPLPTTCSGGGWNKGTEKKIILTFAELPEPHLDTLMKMPGRFSLNTGLNNIDLWPVICELIFHHFRKNVTGTKEQTPRWRICTGTASGSFSSPLGNMYVTKHFNEAAKHAMMEMVRDIRGEFNNILRLVLFLLALVDCRYR